MTERKPRAITFETWIERQVRRASEQGQFDDLPGRGRPIEGLDRPRDENWWIKRKLEDEGVSYLPPALSLRRETAHALAMAMDAGSEEEVREIVDEVNRKIVAALRRPTHGPPVDLMPLDPERVVGDWRRRRSSRGRR